MAKIVQERLGELGFQGKQAKVYVELLELGRASASQIARAAGIPRTTAHSILKALDARGLVGVTREPRGTVFIAKPPHALLHMLDREQESLLTRKQAAQDLVTIIEPYFKKFEGQVPQLQIVEGQDQIEQLLFEQLEQWEQSMLAHDRIAWGFQHQNFVTNYSRWLRHHWERNKKLGLQVRLFSNQSTTETQLRLKVALRTVRPFPESHPVENSIWVMGDYIVIFFTRSRPHIAYQMKDALFAASLRSVFSLLWSFKF